MAKVKVKTSTGFECTVDTDLANNMELVDALAEVDEGKSLAVSKVVSIVLGDQKNAVYDHVREKDGRVPIDAVMNEVTDILNNTGSHGEGKNS